MRVLLAGWFSLADGGATAGDLLVRDVLCGWLQEIGVAYDVAQRPPLGEGVEWHRVAARRYSHLLFACGPVGPSLAVAPLIERFESCKRVAVNVSVVGSAAWRPFDVLLERDGLACARPDLAMLAATPARIGPGGRETPAVVTERPPVVAVVRIHRQGEYPAANPDVAHLAFAELLASREAAAFDLDTVLDPGVPGRRTPAEVLALLGKADIVLTTRLHGMALALAQGVPAIAVDPVPGGAKVLAQAEALGWPAAVTVDALEQGALEGMLDWCLTAAARERALACAARAAEHAGLVKASFAKALRSRR
jgi:Polysaccharide pyruvyl transferase